MRTRIKVIELNSGERWYIPQVYCSIAQVTGRYYFIVSAFLFFFLMWGKLFRSIFPKWRNLEYEYSDLGIFDIPRITDKVGIDINVFDQNKKENKLYGSFSTHEDAQQVIDRFYAQEKQEKEEAIKKQENENLKKIKRVTYIR